MVALTFPSSPVDGQTVVINGTTYIYRSSITAWDVLFNAPSLHAITHELGGTDELLLDQSQITGLTSDITVLGQYSSASSVLRNIPTIVHPAETLLRSAAFWVDSNHSSASGQTVSNLGWGGSVLNAVAGSTITTDSNDPKYLDFDGTPYIYLPGVSGNYMSTPDAAALDVTGDIDIRIRVGMDDWTPSGTTPLAGKNGGAGDRSWSFDVATDGKLRFYWSADGTNQIVNASSVAPSFADGSVNWVRATLDVDTGSGYLLTYYTSTDGLVWTQLGTTFTGTATSIFAGTAVVSIGFFSGANSLAGSVYRAQVLNGINGTPVLDIDTSVITSGSATSFTALTGQTVTINRSTTGRKSVAVVHPCWLFGTDDYMQVSNIWVEHTGTNYAYLPGVTGNYLSLPDAAAFDISDNIDIRARVALSDWTPSAEQMIVSKTGSYALSVTTGGNLRFYWSQNGVSYTTKDSTVPTGVADGSIKWVQVTFDVDNGSGSSEVKFYLSDDGSTWTQLGSTVVTAGIASIYVGTGAVELGSISTGTSPMLGKLYRAQIFNGIGGTQVLDVNVASNVTSNSSSFTASTGGTVTVNRTGTGLRTEIITYSGYVQVNSDTIAPSTYSLLDFGATDSFTVLAVVRRWQTAAATNPIIAKKAGTTAATAGYALYAYSTSIYSEFADGTAQPYASAAISAGAVTTAAGVRSVANDTNTAFGNGTSGTPVTDTTTGTLSNSVVLRVGRDASAYADMEFIAAAVFRKALSAAEISLISNYYTGRVS